MNGLTITVVNEAIGGTATPDWLIGAGSGYLTAAITRALADNAVAMILPFGINDSDAAVNSSPSTFFANMLAICNSILDAGIPLVLPTYPVYMFRTTSPYQASSPALVASYLPMIEALDTVNGKIRVLDRTIYSRTQTNVATEFQGDDLHINQAGVTDWAGQLAVALKPLVQELTGKVLYTSGSFGSGLSTSVSNGEVVVTAINNNPNTRIAMQSGSSAPPIPLWNSAGTDYVYLSLGTP